MKKKKLKLNKIRIAVLKNDSLNQIKGGWDDTPTINDNCDFPPASLMACTAGGDNTWCICNPDDWCGYNHETDCLSPLFTYMG